MSTTSDSAAGMYNNSILVLYSVHHHNMEIINAIYVITVYVQDVIALRQEIKELMELVQKLVTEFQAVKLELEASRIDVDSVQAALCELVASNYIQSSCQ